MTRDDTISINPTDNDAPNREGESDASVSSVTDNKKKQRKVLDRIKRIKKRIIGKPDLIQTSITIKSEQLEELLKRLYGRNNTADFVTGFCGIATGIPLMYHNCSQQTEVGLVSGVIFLFCVTLICTSFYTCVRVFVQMKRNSVNEIIKSLYESKDFTAIALMKAQIGGIPKILVKRQESWQSYFLPYCHFKENDTEEAIKKSLTEEIAHILDIPRHIIEITKYDDKPLFYRIKKNVSQDTTRLIQFRFYFVTLGKDMGRNRFMKSHFSQFGWKSKLELSQDAGTVSNNGDVLAIMDQESLLQKAPYAFSDNRLSFGESDKAFRIIWTITNKCKYDCKLCATNSSWKADGGLEYEKKQKVLMNIASINLNIASLDISGGDPLLDTNDQKIIQQCYRLLPFTKISVTTTAAGLDCIPVSEVSNTVRSCDITYDIPCKKYENEKEGEHPKKRLRTYEYNKSNFQKLLGIREAGLMIDLNIHVPIHTETTNRKDIESLLEDLNKIQPKSIKFIRLMPVGRLSPEAITGYKPEEFMSLVDQIVKEKGYDFKKISMSCALKTQPNIFRNNKARACPMRDEKLGIDSNGNVFACMWAAYLKKYEKVEENPFYLGNLLEESLYDIISRTYPEINRLKEKAKGGCPVIMEAEMSGQITDKQSNVGDY